MLQIIKKDSFGMRHAGKDRERRSLAGKVDGKRARGGQSMADRAWRTEHGGQSMEYRPK